MQKCRSRCLLRITPLTSVACTSSVDTVKAMLELRCSVNPELKGAGVSPLLAVVTLNRGCKDAVQVVRLLLEARADPNTASWQEGIWTFLTWSARAKVALLGRENCAPWTRDFASMPGLTPLMKSTMSGCEEISELLLQHGARVLPNDRGETPQDLAKAQGHYNVLHLFDTVSV